MSSHLKTYGWTADWAAVFNAQARPGRLPARVIAEARETYALLTEEGERSGVLAGRLRAAKTFAAVGDWVCAYASGDGPLRIEALLPRRSRLSRKVAGDRVREQVICANVDRVLLVTSLNADFNARRIERTLTAIWDSGAAPLLVLSKLDAAEGAESMRAEAEAAAVGAPVYAVSAVSGEGLEALQSELRPGETFVLVGSSGVGKSTLVNRLLGREAQAVRDIREDDAKGRHTTTGRRIFALDSGALLVDTPGMRELQLWDDGEGLLRTFEDVEGLMTACRFGDCGHASEPGCAVRAALASGELAAERWENYRKLAREQEFLRRKKDKGAAAEERKKWKKIHLDAQARRKFEGEG